jgi:hypothetical protein
VTTPGNWPVWHPSSSGVGGATDHSLEPGEEVTEEFLVAGRRGRVVWTVRERLAPRRWVIDGRVEGGGGTITFTATPQDAARRRHYLRARVRLRDAQPAAGAPRPARAPSPDRSRVGRGAEAIEDRARGGRHATTPYRRKIQAGMTTWDAEP